MTTKKVAIVAALALLVGGVYLYRKRARTPAAHPPGALRDPYAGPFDDFHSVIVESVDSIGDGFDYGSATSDTHHVFP